MRGEQQEGSHHQTKGANEAGSTDKSPNPSRTGKLGGELRDARVVCGKAESLQGTHKDDLPKINAKR